MGGRIKPLVAMPSGEGGSMVEVAPGAVLFGGIIAFLLTLLILLIIGSLFRREGGGLLGMLREDVTSKDRPPQDIPSLARLQAFVWTFVILFVFSWFYFIRLLSGVATPVPEIPAAILALMGITAGATVASQATPRGELGPPDPTQFQAFSDSLRKNDKWKWSLMFFANGRPSLARVQSFAWTVIAVLVYAWVVYLTVTNTGNLAAVQDLGLPDVDSSLAILTGISQAGYVGAKATKV